VGFVDILLLRTKKREHPIFVVTIGSQDLAEVSRYCINWVFSFYLIA